MKTAKIPSRELALPTVIILAALVAGICEGAEPVTAEPESGAVAPTERKVGLDREVVFSDTEDPVRMQYDPDGELPQHRYVATIPLEFRYPDYESSLPVEVVGKLPPAIQTPGNPYGTSVVLFRSPEVGPFLCEFTGYWWQQPGYTYLDWLPKLVEKMPEAARLPNGVVDELIHRQEDVATTTVNSVSVGATPAPGQIFYLSVCAKDKQRAEELARAALLAIDLGFSPQCHGQFQATAKRLEGYIADLDQQNAETQKKNETAHAELETLSSYNDLNSEALASLVAHRRMIGVDLTGIKARLEACEKILAATAGDPKKGEQRLQVETVKITAEIELAGLAAKKTAVDELIAKGQRRAELGSTISGFQSLIRSRDVERSVATQVLDEYRTAIEQKWAYPKVSGAYVSKIRWEPMSETRGGGFM